MCCLVRVRFPLSDPPPGQLPDYNRAAVCRTFGSRGRVILLNEFPPGLATDGNYCRSIRSRAFSRSRLPRSIVPSPLSACLKCRIIFVFIPRTPYAMHRRKYFNRNSRLARGRTWCVCNESTVIPTKRTQYYEQTPFTFTPFVPPVRRFLNRHYL